MLDADAVINSSSQKVGGSSAYPDPAPKKWVGPDPENTGSTPLAGGDVGWPVPPRGFGSRTPGKFLVEILHFSVF